MTSVFLNGEFVDRDDAKVSAFDAGMQHAIGLFETMRASKVGDEILVFQLDRHTSRLANSARELGLSNDLDEGGLGEAVLETVKRSGVCDNGAGGRVRLSVTGGDLNLLETKGESNMRPTIVISVRPSTPYPDEMFEKGVRAVVGGLRVNPLDPMSGHKTLNYWGRLRELQIAAGKGAGEALMLQVTNHLAGGAVSNAMVVHSGTVITPIAHGEEDEGALWSPILPGTTRAWVLDRAQSIGMTVEKRMVTIDDVLDADELVLTNSSWGVLPVVGIEAQDIGGGTVGEFARSMREAWCEAVGSSQ